MDTRGYGGVTNALPASWVEIGYLLVERGLMEGAPTEFSSIRANPESRVISPYPPHIHFGSVLLARVQYTVVHFGVTGITRMMSISKRPLPFFHHLPSSADQPPTPNLE
ncbi:hypothetical protein EVAR_87327_1 [Eumeta japonica]|uniref:Uncharacterized protein n=1 Tax=Eumeta variegata TaxID=151549 RepID=A0A4C1SC85_EUMVA|nr:hypothetical protein EVAR_87327_1 [Eumeta japonica]